MSKRHKKDKKKKSEALDMCKILLIPGIRKEHQTTMWEFIERVAPHLTKYQTDGFGYAAITKDGDLFGERWVRTPEAFIVDAETTAFDMQVYNELRELNESMGNAFVMPPAPEALYNSFGTLNRDEAVSVMLHARMATSPKGLPNTHPFVENGVAMIHNGVIRNHEKFNKTLSTCDSEACLKAYLKEGVGEDPAEGIQPMVDSLEGYYALGFLGVTLEGVPYMDFMKSWSPNLSLIKIRELDQIVLCTDVKVVEDACAEMSLHIDYTAMVRNGGLVRLNAVTRETIMVVEFEEEAQHSTGRGSGGSGTGTVHRFPGTEESSVTTASDFAKRFLGDDSEDVSSITISEVKKKLEDEGIKIVVAGVNSK